MDDLLSKSLDDIIREKGKKDKGGNSGKVRGGKERTAKTAPFKKHENAPSGNSVYIGNLAFSVSEESLRSHLSSVGTVVSVSVLKSSTGLSRGCAVAVFSDAEAADRAISSLMDTELEGRKIFLREDREAGRSGTRRDAAPKSRASGDITVVKAAKHSVSVRNLPRDITGQELKGIFASCGATGVTMSKKGGAGFVEFKSASQAARAASDFNNALVNGQAILVTAL